MRLNIKNYLKPLTILAWLLFVVPHVIFISDFPLFEDEAQYLLMAEKIMENPQANYLIYLKNGVLPMFGWIIALGTLIFKDSLIVGRIINILLASSLIFWIIAIGKFYKLPRLFFPVGIALFIVSPILALNSRVALLDTSVLVFTAWYIYFTAKITRSPTRLDYFGLVISLTCALFTKATGFLGIPAVILLLILSYKKSSKSNILSIVYVYVSIFILFFLYYLMFEKQITSDTGSSFITHLNSKEISEKVKTNIWLTSHWLYIYYSPYIAAILLFLTRIKSIRKTDIYSVMFTVMFTVMFIWFATSLTTMILLNRFYYPRHTLNLVAPLVVFAACIISESPKKVGILLFTAIVFLSLGLRWEIVTNLSGAKIALEDKFAYFENYTSGTRIVDITKTISNLSEKEAIELWLDGSYIMEYGLKRKLKGNSNITLKSYRLGTDLLPHHPAKVIANPSKKTYVLTNRWLPENLSELTLVKSFPVSFRHSQELYLVR